MVNWRNNNASDLKIEFEEGALDSRGILKDGKRGRVRMQARDSTSRALCSDKGTRQDGSPWPICQAGEVQAALQKMTTHSEGARGGAFGTDARDLAY
jgi:hypothetical protein